MNIVDCLPALARQQYLRLRNRSDEQAGKDYREKLQGIRAASTARGNLRSGHQDLAEWKLKEEFIGKLAYSWFMAAIEVCELYEIPLDPSLCKYIEQGIRELLVAQYQHAINSTASGSDGARVPLSVRSDLIGRIRDCRFPIFDTIKIELENARVASQRRQRMNMPRKPGLEEKKVLLALSDPPVAVQLDELAKRTAMQDDRQGLLRAIETLKTRGFTKFVPLLENGRLVDAANITILPDGLTFLDEEESTEASATKISGAIAPRNPHSAIVIRVVVASPSDVKEEREVVTNTLGAWNAAHLDATGIVLVPVKWETHSYPATGDRPQAFVNRQIIDSADLLIGIFGYRLGTPTGAAQSGTIEEIERFRASGKYVALYFSTSNVPRDTDFEQLKALHNYQEERKKDTLYFTFASTEEFEKLLTQHLPKIVQDVHRQLQHAGKLKGLEEEIQNIERNSEQQLSQIADHPGPAADRVVLADLVSELEDNLNCALKPRMGDTYRRPSSTVWKANRNKLNLPPDLRSDLNASYQQIESWRDVVDSGLSPNLGSMELETTVAGLRKELPVLIERLKQLQAQKDPLEIWKRL